MALLGVQDRERNFYFVLKKMDVDILRFTIEETHFSILTCKQYFSCFSQSLKSEFGCSRDSLYCRKSGNLKNEYFVP